MIKWKQIISEKLFDINSTLHIKMCIYMYIYIIIAINCKTLRNLLIKKSQSTFFKCKIKYLYIFLKRFIKYSAFFVRLNVILTLMKSAKNDI